MGHIPDKVEEFHRRTLSKFGQLPEVAEMLTFIDGKQFSRQTSKKATSMFFVSRPDEEGFTLEITEKGKAPYTEFTDPSSPSGDPHQWQLSAGGSHEEGVFRRSYPIEGEALDKASKIEVVIQIDGAVWLHMEAREPGLMGFVLLGRNSFSLQVVGANGGDYVDRRGPGVETLPVLPWQAEALGLK